MGMRAHTAAAPVSYRARYYGHHPFQGEHMSIFGKIWDRITGHRDSIPPDARTTATSPRPNFDDVRSASSTVSAEPVDVEAIMTDLERKSGHKSNWRVSIVDLMSLLGIPNSLAERRELAKELGYTGSTDDTATMNIWLHKQVMQKLAANGGKVPQELL
jgi:hypothetical protein